MTAPDQPHPDPLQPPTAWEDPETAELRAFLALTPTQKFRLLMQAIEFMRMLRPLDSRAPGHTDSSTE